jgi:hypothetical protein
MVPGPRATPAPGPPTGVLKRDASCDTTTVAAARPGADKRPRRASVGASPLDHPCGDREAPPGRLPQAATDVLLTWFLAHAHNPVPTRVQFLQLVAVSAGAWVGVCMCVWVYGCMGVAPPPPVLCHTHRPTCDDCTGGPQPCGHCRARACVGTRDCLPSRGGVPPPHARAQQTGLTPTQVRNYLTNRKKRNWAPVHRGRAPRSFLELALQVQQQRPAADLAAGALEPASARGGALGGLAHG